VRAGDPSHGKGCAAAYATMTATFATRLAQAGMTGPPAVFTGTDGFEHHITDGKPLSLEFSADDRGRSIADRTWHDAARCSRILVRRMFPPRALYAGSHQYQGWVIGLPR